MRSSPFACAILICLVVLLAADVAPAQETGQSLYLKASAMIRDGDFAGAKVLLQRILTEFSDDEIALKADDRLAEILERANAQQRERSFPSGPGLYFENAAGTLVPLDAFTVTRNNLAAESRRPEDGIVRALSDNLPYPTLIVTDVARLLLHTAAQDLNVFRVEQIKDEFPYDTLHDAGPLPYRELEPELYEIDLAFLAEALRRRSPLAGISAPLHMGFPATFVSQATGTWGATPGPAVCIVWPMRVCANFREWLAQTSYGAPAAKLKRAEAHLQEHPDDASIDWFIAEQYAQLGDLAGFREWSARQEAKALARGDAAVAAAATENLQVAGIIEQMSALLRAPEDIDPASGVVPMLERVAADHKSHAAYYLLSLCRQREGDFKEAESLAKKARGAVKRDTPLLWYCGLLGDPRYLDAKGAEEGAKKFYKRHEDAMKKLKK